jgi:UDPglucose 6-dehydrogenase
MKVGIIGLGFVGSAVKNAYDNANVQTVCNDPGKGIDASYEEMSNTDAIFICVPSPQAADGSCDTSILEEVLTQYKDYSGIIISKVTANPLKYKELQKKHKKLIHAPEFLVAATAKQDYANGQFAIIGGLLEFANEALDIIKLGQPNITNFKFCTIQEAALAKYTINSFLATKVIFMNQLKLIADATESNYNTITDCIKLDHRIGTSHMAVPGPDGSVGFGGACFPKDTSALTHLAHSIGVDFSVLDEVIKVNSKLRNTL